MARIVDFFDGAQSETAPTIGNIIASGIIQYPDDATYEANEQNAPLDGNIYYNTTSDLLRYYSDGAWSDIVDEDSLQAVINKTIDADVNTISNLEDDNIKASAAINVTKLHDGSVDNTEFGHLDGVTSSIQTQLNAKQETSEKGAANGYAPLDGGSLVPAANLPSYVDDVLEFADFASLPVTGETGKIYITLDDNAQYRWTGSVYVLTGAAPVASVAGKIGIVTLSTDDLTDVDTTTVAPSTNDILKFDGTNFVPAVDSTTSALSVITIDQTGTGGTYTVLSTDNVILVDGSTGPIGINLPTAIGITGKVYTFKKITADFAPGILQGFGPQLIDGNATDRVTFENESIMIVSNGVNWDIIASHYEPVYFESEVVTVNSTTTADVYVDSGASLTLPAGTYDIGYSGSLYINRTGAASGVVGTGAIRDSANNVISNTTLQVGVILSGSFAMFPATASTQITLATQTTIKLSARCGTGSANFDVYWVPENFTGALTNPDGGSRMWARRVKP